MPFSVPSISRLLLTSCIAALLLSGCDRSASDPVQGDDALPGGKDSLEAVTGEIDRSRAGESLPILTLNDPEGDQLVLGVGGSDGTGTPMLVNLWATWCAPCIKEMPMLDNLAAEYDGLLDVVTISQDLQGAEAVEPFFAENDLPNLPRWLDPETSFAEAIGAGGLPVTVLYDDAGKELWRVAGDYDWSSEEAHEAIDETLGAVINAASEG